MDKTHIEAIADLAREGQSPIRLDTEVPAVVIGGKIESLEHLQNLRTRYRGRFSTSVIDDFAKYVQREPGGQGFIDPVACAATVFLNLGTTEKPGKGDWTATLKMTPTAAYAAILGINGKRMEQRALVEYVEDWADALGAVTAAGEAVSDGDAVGDGALRALAVERSHGAVERRRQRRSRDLHAILGDERGGARLGGHGERLVVGGRHDGGVCGVCARVGDEAVEIDPGQKAQPVVERREEGVVVCGND